MRLTEVTRRFVIVSGLAFLLIFPAFAQDFEFIPVQGSPESSTQPYFHNIKAPESDGSLGEFNPLADVVLDSAFPFWNGKAVLLEKEARTGEVIGGVFNFTRVLIPAGVTVRFKGYKYIIFTATEDITVDGAMDVHGNDGQDGRDGESGPPAGRGGDGGNGGGGGGAGSNMGNGGGGGIGGSSVDFPSGMRGMDGQGPASLGRPGTACTQNCAQYGGCGAAGGGNGTNGAAGGGPGAAPGGSSFGDVTVGLSPGAAGGGGIGYGGCGLRCGRFFANCGGGGAGGSGGAGGAIFMVSGTDIIITGTLNANGGNGGKGGNGGLAGCSLVPPIFAGCNGGGGGGGGAGGFIFLQAPNNVTMTGQLQAYGGQGGPRGLGRAPDNRHGFAGGPGGGGRIVALAGKSIAGITDDDGTDATPPLDDGTLGTPGTPTIRAITVSLTQTPLPFVPRNHVAEGSLTCDGCYQDYTATINPPSVMGKIRFELYDVSAFRGDATNHCFNTSCTDPLDAAPDYYFNLSAQPPGVFDPPTSMDQTIQTASEVNSATVRVSSRDYGGVAKIRATAIINGVEVTAAVEGTQDLFARIPLDDNQNGIADGWEAQYGGNLDPNRDDEDGPAGSQSPGDGYTALEEYRGFFVLDSGTPRHRRTDPVNRKDVFFWNPDSVLSTSILFPETPFFQYHEIAANSANPRNPTNPADGVNRHNFNSSSAQQTFALVYVNRPLGGNCATVGTVILGDAGSQVNDGSAIRIDGAQIAACATRFVFPGAVLQAQVSAHETGHKYGLSHPVRNAPYVDVPPPTLPMDRYTRQVGLNRFYVWYEDYLYLSIRIKAENAIYGVLDLVNNTAADILGETIFFRPVGSDSAIFQIDLRNPLDTTANRILVNIQQRRIMDWTPRFTLQMMTDWHYDPAEPPRMCVRSSCP